MEEIERIAQLKGRQARHHLLLSTMEVTVYEDGFKEGAKWALEICGCQVCMAKLKEHRGLV